MRLPRAIRLLLLLVAVALACGDDDGGGDSGDGDGPTPDALAATTPCPPTADLECDSATEICVVQTPIGPAETSSCQPVPAGCDAERDCECAGAEICTGSFDTCSEDRGANTIVCECPQCQ
jgi:hypothetical protein